jgi:hypothetical protein
MTAVKQLLALQQQLYISNKWVSRTMRHAYLQHRRGGRERERERGGEEEE